MNAWDDPGRREELDWTRSREPDEPDEPDETDGLVELIRRTIDEETRDLVFPDAMAQRVIHGSRARRPWKRVHVTLLVGAALVSSAGVVGAAALVPGLVSHGGEPTMTAPSTGVSVSATPDPSRLVTVGYVPRGWRPAPLVDTPGGTDPRVWTVRYVPAQEAGGDPARGGRRSLSVMVAVGPDWFAEARRREAARDRALRPHPVTVGRAVEAEPLVLGGGRLVETRIYWEPRAGLLVSVQGVGMPGAEIRKVVSGLRLAA